MLSEERDVNVKNRLGQTPLHVAARLGFANLCKELCTKFGADQCSQDLQGRAAIHYAIEYRQTEAFNVLLDLSLKEECIFEALNSE